MNLFQGDCLEVLKDIPDGSVDMVLADLPYGITACKWDVFIPFDKLWPELHRVTKPNSAIAMFGSEPFSSVMRMSNLKNFKYDWFVKKNYNSGIYFAKYQPMRSIEIVTIFAKEKTLYFPQSRECAQSTKKRYNDGDDILAKGSKAHSIGASKQKIRYNVYPINFLDFKWPTHSIGTLHPTQKPVALLEYLIKTYTNEGDIVLDPTMGSGSTGVACKNLNRKFIGIEKDANYFAIAKKRIEDHHVEGKLL